MFFPGFSSFSVLRGTPMPGFRHHDFKKLKCYTKTKVSKEKRS
jgi:hypothetical protein